MKTTKPKKKKEKVVDVILEIKTILRKHGEDAIVDILALAEKYDTKIIKDSVELLRE
jgi:hypothetical protein